MLRRFALERQADPSGVSGTGVVAYGVEFADGQVVLRWDSPRPATSVWNSLADLLGVHGHDGNTTVQWLDPDSTPTPLHRQPGDPVVAPQHPAAGRHRAD